MSRSLRIGNAHGFWGDRIDAAAEMLALEPDLDFLTLDFLAEVSMSILALQRQRDPDAGFAGEFVEIAASLVPYWRSGGRCRVITNAGGLNPKACANACRQALERAGCPPLSIAVVSGDDVLELLRSDAGSGVHKDLSRNLDTGESLNSVVDRLITANAYLGAQPIVEALDRGADMVITGRVADPSLTVAPCLHHFRWPSNDWDRFAGATVAGHLIECGAQVTGGISTDWLDVPDVDRIGFPIVEVAEDGSCVVTKPRGSGGWVTESTVKEQLVYEIGDPDNYLSPDVAVSFRSLRVQSEAADRVRVDGAKGRPASDSLKVSATWQDGFRAAGQLTVFGDDVVEKARRAADLVLGQLRRSGAVLRETIVELIGTGVCYPGVGTVRAATAPPCGGSLATSATVSAVTEIVLRIAVADDSRENVERFSRAIMPLITSGPPGTTGYAEGRPRVHARFQFWPCLINRSRVRPEVEFVSPWSGDSLRPLAMARHVSEVDPGNSPPSLTRRVNVVKIHASLPRILADIALARSGDKGRNANIGVIVRDPNAFDRLCDEVTVERVAQYFGIEDTDRVERFELPNLGAVNLLIRDILNPLRLDAQGKTLGQVLLRMPLIQTHLKAIE